jgi:hypothetical protein
MGTNGLITELNWLEGAAVCIIVNRRYAEINEVKLLYGLQILG